jgi:diacylglycerol kinase (ATP)
VTSDRKPDPRGPTAQELDVEGLRDPSLDTIPPPFLRTGAFASFRAASAGVCRTLATQRNMKLHVLAALMVAIVGMALPLDVSARVALLFAISIVFFAEILNSALEALIDLFIRDFHRLAMLAKDAAAAGVLVLATATVLVFADILWARWDLVTANLDAVRRSVSFGVPLVVVEAVGLFVVRRGAFAIARVVVALALAAPLVVNTQDPIWAFVALLLVGMSAYARWAFPRRAGRGAPRRAGDAS